MQNEIDVRKLVAEGLKKEEPDYASWRPIEETFRCKRAGADVRYEGRWIPVISGNNMPEDGDVYGDKQTGMLEIVTDVTYWDSVSSAAYSGGYIDIYEIRIYRVYAAESWTFNDLEYRSVMVGTPAGDNI